METQIKELIRKKIKSSKYFLRENNYYDISSFKNNILSISPQGGGFVKFIDVTKESFINDFKKGKFNFKNDMPMEWKKVKLFHDHWISDNNEIEHYIEGYVTNHKWNGWSIPMVELDQIKKFNEIQVKTKYMDDFAIFKIIDDKNISIRDFNEDEIITLERSEFQVNGKTIKAFDVSLGWTWSEEKIN